LGGYLVLTKMYWAIFRAVFSTTSLCELNNVLLVRFSTKVFRLFRIQSVAQIWMIIHPPCQSSSLFENAQMLQSLFNRFEKGSTER
jgi:hypothetical protein